MCDVEDYVLLVVAIELHVYSLTTRTSKVYYNTVAQGRLEFELPDESSEFKRAVYASSMASVIHHFDNYLRSRLKYEELDTEVEKAVQRARDHLHELCEDIPPELLW
jgi:hypothetical protein